MFEHAVWGAINMQANITRDQMNQQHNEKKAAKFTNNYGINRNRFQLILTQTPKNLSNSNSFKAKTKGKRRVRVCEMVEKKIYLLVD